MGENSEEGEGLNTDRSKKEIITNAWLLAPKASIKPIAEYLDITYQYVWSVRDDLENGELSPTEIEKFADRELQTKLKQAFQEIDVLGGVSMSIQLTPPENYPSDQDGGDDELAEKIEDLGLSKRELLINIWCLDESVTHSASGTAAGCSGEYARQVFSNLDQNESPDNQFESVEDNEAQELLRARLVKMDAVKPDPNAAAEKAEPQASLPENGVVSVDELLHLWDSIDTLRREAIAELEVDASATAAKQKFVSEEVLRRLDESLEEADTPRSHQV